ncbi:MAG TPA: sigma-54 dependent transcriptional regulator, partial [Longimicrobiales bacterium]
YIHRNSPFCSGPFVKMNCAAIPTELLESEMFGHEKGAFTGAAGARRGKFELADGGTLFLDEIGDMPLTLQPKLLRVLQEGAVERLGSNASRLVDVRVVAATHRDLSQLVDEGAFRADLYYRLAVVPIHVPPLRERPDDVAPLARHLVERFGRRIGRTPQLAPSLIEQMEAYSWPGNVRELGNILERAVLLTPGEVLEHADLPEPRPGASPAAAAAGAEAGEVLPLRDAVDDAERRAIRAALRRTGGNKTKAAELLQASIRTLWYKLEKLGIAAE